jgi:hypothetical protein
MSSASRIGVSIVFSGVEPAPDTPGTVESRVFPRMAQKSGFLQATSGISERNPIRIYSYILMHSSLKISVKSTTI